MEVLETLTIYLYCLELSNKLFILGDEEGKICGKRGCLSTLYMINPTYGHKLTPGFT